MSKISIDESLTGKALFDFLVTNKKVLIAEKKMTVKRADPFCMSNLFIDETGQVSKGTPFTKAADDKDIINPINVINTTNWLDSHKDVHFPNIWKKSLTENKDYYLLQEHEMTFKGIITDQVDAYTKVISWKALGYKYAGDTEALIFDSKISKNRNEFMFNEYRLGHVKNHSVGMRYVKIEMAINDEDYKEEFAVWNKYIDQVVNRQDAEDGGYFWAVTEAKVIEGSAVPIGSNRATPVLEMKTDTEEQPPIGTEKQPSQGSFDIDIKQLLQNFSLKSI